MKSEATREAEEGPISLNYNPDFRHQNLKLDAWEDTNARLNNI